jgi:uncharacterized 2Fe-2S/4Fe-4S cluster protein (DUF4445 family)
MPQVHFQPEDVSVEVDPGTTLLDSAVLAGIEIPAHCGGQGSCGRCRVRLLAGRVNPQAGTRLTPSEIADGWTLACKTRVFKDVVIDVPGARKREDKPAAQSKGVVFDRERRWQREPGVRVFLVTLEPPSLSDNTSDLDRLRRALSMQHGIADFDIGLPVLRVLGNAVRHGNWRVAVVGEVDGGGTSDDGDAAPLRVIDVRPANEPLHTYGLAVDIGTTGVEGYLINSHTGRVVATAGLLNKQTTCGPDIISRIAYSRRGDGLATLQRLVAETINEIIDRFVTDVGIEPDEIYEVSIAGNTTMVHLLLGVDPEYIRRDPYTPTVATPPMVLAAELGLNANSAAGVHCIGAVGSYVGGDITSGVYASGTYKSDKLTLFIDVGTNGEMVLGNADWLISCACSAGPAFEGGGVKHGMRAEPGAIDSVTIDPATCKPTFHTIGDEPARGLCGSGLIELLGELLLSGVIDKSGKIDCGLPTDHVRTGEWGTEYVVAWAGEAVGSDVVITEPDIDNLMRAKAAVYAGATVLCQSVGMQMADVEEVLIGGAFGAHLSIEKAIQIGLLPDMPSERFRYLGNTSGEGACAHLFSLSVRREMRAIASRMTYLELSVDNSFTDAYMSALFLPHTDLDAFPSVKALLEQRRDQQARAGAAGASNATTSAGVPSAVDDSIREKGSQ